MQTLKAVLHWWTLAKKQFFFMIFCSIQNKRSSPFLGLCMFLNFGHFSASCSYKKVLIIKDWILFCFVLSVCTVVFATFLHFRFFLSLHKHQTCLSSQKWTVNPPRVKCHYIISRVDDKLSTALQYILVRNNGISDSVVCRIGRSSYFTDTDQKIGPSLEGIMGLTTCIYS